MKLMRNQKRVWWVTAAVLAVLSVGVADFTPPANATLDAVARWKVMSTDDCTAVEDVTGTSDGAPVSGCSDSTNFSTDNPRGSAYGQSYDVKGSHYIWGTATGMFPDDDTADVVGYNAYTGSRAMMAWVRLNANPTTDEKGIVYIGRDSGGGGSVCTESAHGSCRGFHLVLTLDKYIRFGPAQGGSFVASGWDNNGDGDLLDSVDCTADEAKMLVGTSNSDFKFVLAYYSKDDADTNETYDSYVYINNKLCGKGNIVTPYTDVGSASRLSIGGTVDSSSFASWSTQILDGDIDDVRVFDRTIGSVERSTLWNASSNGGAD